MDDGRPMHPIGPCMHHAIIGRRTPAWPREYQAGEAREAGPWDRAGPATGARVRAMPIGPLPRITQWPPRDQVARPV